MRITKVETIALTVPAKWIWGSRPHSFTFIRVSTDTDLVGWGETLLGLYMPELVFPLVDHFGRVIIDQDPNEISGLRDSMFVKAMRWGHVGPAISVLGGIEIALWDILAQSMEQPLHALLGGRSHESLRCYASSGAPAYPLDTTLKAFDEFAEQGYSAIKTIHGYAGRAHPTAVGELVRQEQEKFGTIREHLGWGVDLMLDPAAPFNRNPWSGDTARQVIAGLEEYGLLWVEQPVLPSRIDDYLEIRRYSKTPLAAGENGTTLEDFRPFFAQRVIDIVQPDAVWCGGIAEMRRIIAASEAHGLRTAPHCFSGAVGLAANYHVALASPSCFIVELPTAGNPLIRPLLERAFSFEKGRLIPTGAPGLGVDIPDEILNQYPFVPGSGLSHPRSPFPRPIPSDWKAPAADSLSWDADPT